MLAGLHCSPGSSPSSVWPAAERFFVRPPALTLKQLDKVLYGICVTCIVLGLLFVVILIWGDWADELLGKAFSTNAAVFVASTLILAISRAIQRSGDPRA